jgi:hypothetical protein
MEWNLIESAPKDGTLLLICSGDYLKQSNGYPTTASWRAYHPNAKGKECWRDTNGYKIHPTHWMDLPVVPKAELNKI